MVKIIFIFLRENPKVKGKLSLQPNISKPFSEVIPIFLKLNDYLYTQRSKHILSKASLGFLRLQIQRTKSFLESTYQLTSTPTAFDSRRFHDSTQIHQIKTWSNLNIN